MRRLAQPSVLKSAGLAALLTSLVCYPRFAQWQSNYATWYAEAVMFFGSFVLWAFVFAWHTEHAGRPVFNHRIEPRLWLAATVAGLLGCVLALVGTTAANQFLSSGLQLKLTPGLVALGLALSVVMGTLGGLYPAWRAARLVPMEAIRLGGR